MESTEQKMNSDMASRSNDENIPKVNVQERKKRFEALASKTGAANRELHEEVFREKEKQLQDLRENLEQTTQEVDRENEQLQGENEQLPRENDQVKKEKEQLPRENDQVKKEKEQLPRENDQVKKEKEQLQSELDWRKASNKIDDITLDRRTAHPNLSIAGDQKSLTHEAQPQKYPPAPERFDSTVCVLGSEGFSDGQHYWEVDVGSSTDWDLGVARKSIARKGKLSLYPKEGFWVLSVSGRDYWAKTDPWTRVTVQKKPKKIGVYLSYEEGQVTFFSVTDMSVLFTFKDCSFSGEVCPFFKNSHKETTMKICLIKEED